MERVTVNLGDRSYPIYIGAHVLPEVGSLVRPCDLSGRGALITNPVVGQLYGQQVLSSFARFRMGKSSRVSQLLQRCTRSCSPADSTVDLRSSPLAEG